jgi:hypothetical protein
VPKTKNSLEVSLASSSSSSGDKGDRAVTRLSVLEEAGSTAVISFRTYNMVIVKRVMEA